MDADTPPPKNHWPLTVARLVVVGALLYLWMIAAAMPHNLDEVHGYNSYVRLSIPWDRVLSEYPEPGHHVVHNILLRLVYPLLEGTRVSLRWTMVICCALTTWMAYRWGRQSAFNGLRDRTGEWTRVPLILVPMCLSFFMFYGAQSRGYMIGTTCFLGFFILSQRLHRPVKWGFDPLAGFGMGLLASLSIGSVLSNGTFVVGACFGFGLIDLFRRHWRVFVARVLFMVGGATFLVAFHPVTRHLEKLEQFNHMFGLKVGEWETPLGVTGRYLSDVLWPYPILLGSLAVLGFLTWIIRKNLLWIPIVTILLTIVGVVWWGQNYQFSRSYMTLTILVILLIQGFGEGVLALLERYTKPVVVWVASGLLVVAGLAGWSAQYEGIQESYAGWVFGIDTHEWHAQSAPYSIEMMPWDIYQGYYYDHPDVEDKIARLYEQRKIGQIQLLSFIGTPPIITGSPSLPEVPIPVLTPGEVIGDTGRQRWTFSDVHYLDEWQSQPPEPLQEACDFCFVLLLTKAGMWFHPEFGEVPVSGLHFNRPYEESEMAGHLIFGHVVPNPADLPAAVARLQQTDAYVGPVRAFVVGF